MSQTATISAPKVSPAAEERPRWRWTREAFARMCEAGLFGPADRVELIEGDIIALSPPNPLHSGAVRPNGRLLEDAFGLGFCARMEQPIVTGGDTQPQPDIAVCVGSDADFRRRFPVASEVRLIVEIADSTVETDRVKGAVYATAEIAEYWILNLRDQQLEVYRDPADGQYLSRRIYRPAESVAPLGAPSQALVSVSALLGL